MKKVYTKTDLQAKAKAVFKNYPNATQVYATTDGNIFLSNNRAELHAGPKGEVIPLLKCDIESPEDVKPLPADVLIENAATLTLDAVEKALADENVLPKPRKTVIEAYQNRINELNTKA